MKMKKLRNLKKGNKSIESDKYSEIKKLSMSQKPPVAYPQFRPNKQGLMK